MSTDTTLALSYLDPNNVAGKKSITYANPAASNADLVNFNKALVGLTDNTYVSTTRIDTMKLD